MHLTWPQLVILLILLLFLKYYHLHFMQFLKSDVTHVI